MYNSVAKRKAKIVKRFILRKRNHQRHVECQIYLRSIEIKNEEIEQIPDIQIPLQAKIPSLAFFTNRARNIRNMNFDRSFIFFFLFFFFFAPLDTTPWVWEKPWTRLKVGAIETNHVSIKTIVRLDYPRPATHECRCLRKNRAGSRPYVEENSRFFYRDLVELW